MAYNLELSGVCKAYPGGHFSLNDVTFSVPKGTIVGLVGENGAGKTTMIGCILGTTRRDAGEIRIFGQEMTDADTALREQIGVVYDGDNFPGHLCAGQLADIMRGLYTSWDDAAFDAFLSRFSLPREQKIKAYSRGMGMKLALSAALAHHPKLLILDEATGGLDPVMREELLDVFLEFVQDEEHSILLSSHITSDLERVADYIVFVHRGRVILTAAKDELRYNYAVLRCRKSDFARIDARDILAYRERDFQTDVLVADGRAAARKYGDIAADHPSLDEIMLLLIKGERA